MNELTDHDIHRLAAAARRARAGSRAALPSAAEMRQFFLAAGTALPPLAHPVAEQWREDIEAAGLHARPDYRDRVVRLWQSDSTPPADWRPDLEGDDRDEHWADAVWDDDPLLGLMVLSLADQRDRLTDAFRRAGTGAPPCPRPEDEQTRQAVEMVGLHTCPAYRELLARLDAWGVARAADPGPPGVPWEPPEGERGDLLDALGGLLILAADTMPARRPRPGGRGRLRPPG